MIVVDDLAELIRAARRARGMTQQEFAAEIGRRQSLISKYERGLVEPPGDVVAHCLRVTQNESGASISPAELARMIEERLSDPAFAKLLTAIATILESIATNAELSRADGNGTSARGRPQ